MSTGKTSAAQKLMAAPIGRERFWAPAACILGLLAAGISIWSNARGAFKAADKVNYGQEAAWLPAGVHGQAYMPANIVDAMDGAMILNQFKAAVTAAGLLDALASPDFNGTVFAPNDLGFAAWLSASNTTLEALQADNTTLTKLIGFHIVPGIKLFPLAVLAQGAKLNTLEGAPLTVDRSVPGLIHIYGAQNAVTDPFNFGTVLQYQEIRGGTAVLYVIDKPLVPPGGPAGRLQSAPQIPGTSG